MMGLDLVVLASAEKSEASRSSGLGGQNKNPLAHKNSPHVYLSGFPAVKI